MRNSFTFYDLRPEVKNKSYHISSIYRFGFLTMQRQDFVLQTSSSVGFYVDCQSLKADSRLGWPNNFLMF